MRSRGRWLRRLRVFRQFQRLDAFEEGGRLGVRLHAQLLGQNLAAALVLSQSRVALAAAGQQGHHLPAGLLAQGVQLQLALRPLDAGLILTAGQVVVHQALQGRDYQSLQPLPLDSDPLFKAEGAAQVKAGQEITLVKGQGHFELSGCVWGKDALFQRLLGHRRELCLQLHRVQPVVGIWIETHRAPVDVQMVAQGTQPAEEHAQVGHCPLLGQVVVEQIRQRFAGNGPLVAGQVTEQRCGLA